MRYPIDEETLLMELGAVSERREAAYRAAVRLVNSCYEDGLCGASGYPLDLDEECQAFAEASGKDLVAIRSNPLIPPLLAWCNMAYEQGRKEETNENQA